MHRFVNDLERPVGTYLYGRKMSTALDVLTLDGTAIADLTAFVLPDEPACAVP